MRVTGTQPLLCLSMALVSTGCTHRTTRTSTPTAVGSVMRRQVLNAIEAGEGDPVVSRLRRQVAAEPDNPEPRLELAAHFGKAQPELELEHLRLAAERFPASREAHMGLANALRKASQPGQAAEILGRYLRANPAATADPELWNRLGVCYDEAGDWKSGEQAFRSGLGTSPNLDYLSNNLGYNLLEQGRTSEAIAILRQALQHNPRSETARNNLGLALARSRGGTTGEALHHFENTTDAATAHSNLAAVLMEQQRYDESRRQLQAALDYNRSSAVALANLAVLSELDGRPATMPLTRRRWPVTFFRKMFAPASPRTDRPAEAAQGDKP